MKNKIFNCTRFYNLIRSDLVMNYKRYGLVLAGAAIGLYLILVWGMYMEHHSNIYDYRSYFFFWSFAALILFGGYSFSEFSNKIRTGNYLLLPASNLEKFLYQFLVKGITITTVFLLIFWIDAQLARHTVLNIVDKTHGSWSIDVFQYSELLSETINLTGIYFWDKLLIVTAILSLMCFVFSARLFFGRLAIVKIAIAFIVTIFLYTCVFVLLSHIFYTETSGFDIRVKGYKICENLYNTQLCAYCIAYGSWIFFLIIGYFKLKEKQG